LVRLSFSWTGQLLHLAETDFLKTFEISIQFGAILSVVVLYWKRFFRHLNLVGKLAAAFIPTGIIGFVLYKIVKSVLMESDLVIACSLTIGGFILILFETWYAKKYPDQAKTEDLGDPDQELEQISYKQAALLGVAQSVAMVPGVSRSAATIVGGLAMGIKRRAIVEFSFLLAVPTMLAATGYDLYKNPAVLTGDQLSLWLVGFITSFVTAILGIKFFLKYIQKNDFKAFGWYRIVIGIIILSVLFLK
jgi:undecaprenyl-diphosphatase